MLHQAVRNNAAWCAAICRAHGIGGAVHGLHWRADASPPRFYPDLITLAPDAQPEQRAAIAAVARDRARWSVKDSYAVLNLADFGASVLFEAQWQWRAPAPAKVDAVLERIATEAALAEWERAWTDDGAAPRIFLPPLLDEDGVAFVALRQGGKIAAGAIFNRAHGVCGLSNVFGAGAARIVAAAAQFAPDLPLVCYERTVLPGFEPLGRLRIWACR